MADLVAISKDAIQVIFRSKNGDTIIINGVEYSMANKLFTITAGPDSFANPEDGYFHFELVAGSGGQGQYKVTFTEGTATDRKSVV